MSLRTRTIGSVMAGLALAAGFFLSPARAEPGRGRLQGCWEVLASPVGAPDIHGLIAFQADGTATGETVFPTVSGAYGSWKPLGQKSFTVDLVYLRTNSDGSFDGRTRVRSVLTVDRDSTEASGDFVAELFDARDHLLTTVEGTVFATPVP